MTQPSHTEGVMNSFFRAKHPAAPIAIVLAICPALMGQGRVPVKTSPKFEVVSVRMASPDDRQGAMAPRVWGEDGSGRISLRHIPLKYVFMRAFQLDEGQLVGPAWLETDFFDILATVPKMSKTPDVLAMLRNMLAERFNATWHMDSQVSSVNVLTVSPKGHHMKEVQEIAPPDEPSQSGIKTTGSGDKQTLSSHGDSPFGAVTWVATRDGDDLDETTTYSSMTMPGLSKYLSQFFERPVVDKTGLTGHYEVKIRRTSSVARTIEIGSGDAPSVEDLGLKITRQDLKIDKLLIDHIERRPTDN